MNLDTPQIVPAAGNWDHLTKGGTQIRRFLNGDRAGIFVLKGKYGSGKSYFLRELVLKDPDIQKKFPTTAYTSVFGLDSLAALTEAAIGSLRFFTESTGENWFSRGKQLLQKIGPQALERLLPNLPALTLIWHLAHERGLLLVIDDIDRRGDGLALKEIIGFANSLVEHTSGKVKVVLVVNEDELNETDRNAWDYLREKFIDAEFAFHPTPAELARHYVESPDLKDVIARIHTAFASPNIRTMLKVEGLVNGATDYLKVSDISLVEEERHHAAKLAALFLAAGREYPVEMLTERRRLWEFVLSTNDEPRDELSRYNQKADSIDFLENSALDELLIQYFRDGWIPQGDIDQFRSHRVSEQETRAYLNDQRALWSLVHESFRDTTTQFLGKVQEHIDRFAPQVSVKDMRGVVGVVTKLGGDAVPLWRSWLNHHRSTLRLDQRPGLEKLVPQELHALLPEFAVRGKCDVDPKMFLAAQIGHTPLHDPQDEELLAQWTPDEWQNWLESTDYGDVLEAVGSILRTSGGSNHFQKIKTSVTEAVQQLVQKSPMNRLRAERYAPHLINSISPESSEPDS